MRVDIFWCWMIYAYLQVVAYFVAHFSYLICKYMIYRWKYVPTICCALLKHWIKMDTILQTIFFFRSNIITVCSPCSMRQQQFSVWFGTKPQWFDWFEYHFMGREQLAADVQLMISSNLYDINWQIWLEYASHPVLWLAVMLKWL